MHTFIYSMVFLFSLEELSSEVEQHLNQSQGNLQHLKNVTIDYHKNLCYNNITLPGKLCDIEVVRYILRSVVWW